MTFLRPLFMALLSTAVLVACATPNTPEGENSSSDSTTVSESGEGNFSKAAYIRLLQCLKTQQPDAAAAIDQAISAAQQLPDEAFTNADSPVFALWAKQAEASGCGG